MRRSGTETLSVWQAMPVPWPARAPLRENVAADICVIGAGIAGMTAAYLLLKEGKSVIVIDAWDIAAGETSRTTAHLACVLDDRFHNLEKVFGEENARLAANSHRGAIDIIEKIVKDNSIACDFERLEALFGALTDEERKDLDKEAKACARAGLFLEEIDRVPVPHIKAGPGLRFPQQGAFNMSAYMSGLAKAVEELGGRIYTDTRAVEIKGGGEPNILTEDSHRIDAGEIIVATNTPVNDWVTMHTKQAAYRTFVLAFRVPKDSYQPFLLWDMAEPYHYVRVVRGEKEDFLVVGGEDHKTGQANDAKQRFEKIAAWTRRHFGIVGAEAFRWSGQIMEPVDHLGFAGRNPMDKNVYIITGDSGNGITNATAGAQIIADLIMGRDNPYADLFAPARKSLRTAPTYVQENANFVGCMVSDWAAPAEVSHETEIPAGQGAIMRRGVSKMAVYRDEDGHLHKCSAVCTHLGCVVQWNGGEKSWDCPCHGSRFDTEGRILNGPAVKGLEDLLTGHRPPAHPGDRMRDLYNSWRDEQR